MKKPFLKEQYEQLAVPELKKKFGYVNMHEVPRVVKVVINHGFKADADKAAIEDAQKEISNIAGQHAVITLSKKSISNFKLRENQPIGVKVTLRGNNMYEFLLRLIAVALPGIRDFRGVSAKMDGNGNYTLGLTDHSIFAESHGDHTKKSIGMDITIVTTAENDDAGRELLSLLGMPFRKRTATTPTPAAGEKPAVPASTSAA
jgi:large subunit ribosomal protein L5